MASVKAFQLNVEALDQISRIKKSVGINKNNVICRWAFMLSLKEPGRISDLNLTYDSSGRGEISWETFGGEFSAIYLALLKQRMHQEEVSINTENLKTHILHHINRGLGYILGSGNIRSISHLIALTIEEPK